MSFARKQKRRLEKLTADRPIAGNRHVRCLKHGRVPWLGDVLCTMCGAPHVIDRDTLAHPDIVDGACKHCGAQMFPKRDEEANPTRTAFFAKIACRACVVEMAEKRAKATVDVVQPVTSG